MRRAVSTILGAACALAVAAPAARAENAKVNVQIFRPASHHGDLVTAVTSDLPKMGYWSAGGLFSFGKNPLVFIDKTTTSTRRHELVQDQLTLDLFGSWSLADWWIDLGVAVPLFLVNSGEASGFAEQGIDTGAISSFAPGDVRFSVKQKILQREKGGDGLGVAFDWLFGLPTGDAESFVSDGFTFQPTVVADFRTGALLLVGNSGYRLRDKQAVVFNSTNFLEVDDDFFWRLGASYRLIGEEKAAVLTRGFELTALGEIYGSMRVSVDDDPGVKNADKKAANASYSEAIVGARMGFPALGLHATLGGGSGVDTGYGTTKFRLFLGAGWSPVTDRDTDQDGLMDEVDKCVTEPEDRDDHRDDDGCADPDNDGDSLLDGVDKCPNDAEDADGFQDGDGCPDPDNDGDGVGDAEDLCGAEPEDKDGFKDEDGCPDPDNDGDGVPDVADSCPDKPETKNGYQDDDGCPDQTLAKVERGQIVILDKVYFETGKAVIKEESFPVLKAVAGVLRSNPDIKGVRIEGHTDDKGPDKKNLELSQARAEAVRDFLVAEGIEAARLEAQGLGETKPAVEGKTEEARSANRRVEFHILQ